VIELQWKEEYLPGKQPEVGASKRDTSIFAANHQLLAGVCLRLGYFGACCCWMFLLQALSPGFRLTAQI